MKTIIAGSRNITNYQMVVDAIEACPWNVTTIISGNARGVDSLAIQYAKEHNINVEIYPANWERDGKSAGYKRNTVMAFKAEALIALWDGHSVGTKHMIDTAKKFNLSTFIVRS